MHKAGGAQTADTGATAKRILHGVSAQAESGRLLAVMGPSGAGKSSLVSAVMAHTGTGTGECASVQVREANRHPRCCC
jgi:ABC-type hemin transport system ATPase subunit